MITTDQWRSPRGREIVRSSAIHEAGHAVARWYLERTHYLGRHYVCPLVRHIAVSREGEAIPSSYGMSESHVGIVAADPFIMPFGKVTFTGGISPAQRQKIRKLWRRLAVADIIHVMAGPMSEQIHLGEPYEDAADWRCQESDKALDSEEGTDSWQVEQRIPMLGRQWRIHLEHAFMVADEIVRGHQPHIGALADALVTHGLVEGDDAWALLDR